ncbi:tail fiber domain-containing protein [Klebsiella variicola]|uniref:tail fiber domain-containing protein n=3 Tax=Klebsiella TaxID=570 RepID=UPI0034E014EF
MLDLPQQENSNRENPMKSFKIEYVDGVLTVLETDGQSRMNEAVHGIHFEHVQGVTDAKAAQDASDATASAVSGLTARVTDAEGKITAQAQQQTALATKVDNGSRGWRIAKDGSSQFNNVIVRGAVYATDGWFQGTVYANRIEGDIGSFAINIAQHRTRKVPKATWQWFELARFRRQNFDQVINIRGGLLQTDSITIDGGAKLRAGMSYAPGSDGGLDPGYLSYAMLLRGTGATSGGGSMELGIELMYETGGATRLLTVPAVGGMAKASDLNALAKLTGGNKLDGSQVITSDNAGFILGKNSDLALLKKQGQGGTIAVGSGTPFRVQRSRATTVSPSDTFDDILVIGTDNQTTLPGGLSAGGNIDNTSKGKVLTQAIELSMSTPYIDFHYNGSSADYTARLIHDRQNRLNAQVQSFWVTDGRITASSTMPANPAIGTQLTSNPVRSLMAGRGAYGDVDGAYVQMYMEEQVGTEHRLVLYADGFGRTDAWIFRAGGTISTGKGDVLTTGSDVRLKDAFMEPQEGASRRINSLGVCEFNMKGETRRRRGFIAQQAEKVDDLYTFLGIEQEIDGEKFRVMNVDYTAIIADLVTVVQDLIRRVDALES